MEKREIRDDGKVESFVDVNVGLKKKMEKEKGRRAICSAVVFVRAGHVIMRHYRISYAFSAPRNNQSHPSLQWR